MPNAYSHKLNYSPGSNFEKNILYCGRVAEWLRGRTADPRRLRSNADATLCISGASAPTGRQHLRRSTAVPATSDQDCLGATTDAG